MEKEQIKPFIAARVAQELKDGDVVNLGIGLPTLVPNYLNPAVKIILQSENGIIDAGPKPSPETAEPYYVTDAGGKPSSVALGGSFIDSNVSFTLMRGGHLDATVLGALQVDQEGNLANWIIPGKKVPGMGGAMDLVVGAKKVIVAMEHTQGGAPKILKKATLPLTATKCVTHIMTEMCVFEVTPSGLVMTEINPEFTEDDVRKATEADFTVSSSLKKISVQI
ncbi:MAG: 3-oxoacid CoA-transferase subunit B [Treponema sp.]|nr:3-oxoacid CoA-transferase subunit B [Treponema sp.]